MGDGRWRSGAALSVVTAGTAVGTQQALRAASAGPAWSPGWLVVAALGLALLLWPLAARTTRVVTLAGLLAAAQVGTHVVAVVAAGQFSSARPVQLVCCPSADQVRPGVLGHLTAQAGPLLLAVQLVACLLLAVLLRGARQLTDDVHDASKALAAVTLLATSRLGALARLAATAAALIDCPFPRLPATPADRLLGAGRVVTGTTRRRGPPAAVPVPARPTTSRTARPVLAARWCCVP